jgi:hypothetical protein
MSTVIVFLCGLAAEALIIAGWFAVGQSVTNPAYGNPVAVVAFVHIFMACSAVVVPMICWQIAKDLRDL